VYVLGVAAVLGAVGGVDTQPRLRADSVRLPVDDLTHTHTHTLTYTH